MTEASETTAYVLPDGAAPIPGDAEALALVTRQTADGRTIVPYYAWMNITPDFARAALRNTFGAAKVKGRDISFMARDMRGGRWRLNGEPIIVSDDGSLLAGRRRFAACIEADCAFPSLVIFNIEGGAWETIDTQRTRKLADTLQIRKEPHYRSIATMLGILWRLRGGTFDRGPLGSDLELLHLLDNHRELIESLAVADARGRVMRLPLFASMHFLLSRVDKAKAGDFFSDMLKDGTARGALAPDKRLPEGHPARLLNDRLATTALSGERMSNSKGAASVILAWNHYYTGQQPKTYRWEPGDSAPFPAIAGWHDGSKLNTEFDDEEGEAQPHGDTLELPLDVASPEAPLLLDTPSVRLELVDREKAAAFLERNTNNRGMRRATIDRYVRDIKSGRWLFNGETAKFGRSGRLLDAQHRCQAIVEADGRLPMIVVSGIDEEAINTMDRGVHRDFGDVLAEREVTQSATIAAAARLLWLYEANQFTRVTGISLSNVELDELLRRHPDLMESLRFSHRLRGLLYPATACLIEYWLMQIDEGLAEDFLTRLATGAELKVKDPILVLRDALKDLTITDLRRQTRRGSSAETTGARPPAQLLQLACCINAWNLWIKGKKLEKSTSLMWRGAKAAPFPELDSPRATSRKSTERAATNDGAAAS